MSKDMVLKKIITVELEVTIRTNDTRHCERTLKERCREICVEVWSGECKTGYSTSISTKKSKYISMRDILPKPSQENPDQKLINELKGAIDWGKQYGVDAIPGFLKARIHAYDGT